MHAAPQLNSKGHGQAEHSAALPARELLADLALPMSESRALLAQQLGIAREGLIARPDQLVAPDVQREFRLRVERRQRGEPLAYLLGEKEFYGRAFIVSPAVLIPRPETELLIDVALGCQSSDAAAVLELGTGSGCVAITLALERPRWRITATDLATGALDIARENIDRWQVTNLSLQHGPWFGAVSQDAPFQLIVSNPPYVAMNDPHLDALRFEPRLALTADDDGFSSLRAIIETAPPYLAPGGALVLEHGSTQAAAVRALLAAQGGYDVQTASDLAGLERVTRARFSGV